MISFRQLHDFEAEGFGPIADQLRRIFRMSFPYDPGGFERISRIIAGRAERDYEPIMLVALNRRREVTGFAFFIYFRDLRLGYLQNIASDPERPARGVGGALYEALCEILERKSARGLLLDVAMTDIERVRDPAKLPINRKRLAFYTRYGARMIEGTGWDRQPNLRNGNYLTHLLFHALGSTTRLSRALARNAARRILCSQYSYEPDDPFVEKIVRTFQDDPVRLSAPATLAGPSTVAPADVKPKRPRRVKPLHVVVAEGHQIHHLKERGYVERPVRMRQVLRGLEDLPVEMTKAHHFADSHILAVHDHKLFDFMKELCSVLPPKTILYPNTFPIRQPERMPERLEDRVGYYCSDTFTPLTHHAFQAARKAIDATLTAAEIIRDGERFAYALVRPPGHHAEARIFGGFCYLNNSAVAAHYLARSHESRVALLDIDYHHGNGAQDIFYKRADVFTLSIHGHPRRSFPYFCGYDDEQGEGPGLGYNRNWPLEPNVDDDRYVQVLDEALAEIRAYAPKYLVLSLGFDIMRGDPTGSFVVSTRGLRRIAERIGRLGLPTLVVQEGGYAVRNLRIGAESFFSGLAGSWFTDKASP